MAHQCHTWPLPVVVDEVLCNNAGASGAHGWSVWPCTLLHCRKSESGGATTDKWATSARYLNLKAVRAGALRMRDCSFKPCNDLATTHSLCVSSIARR